MIFPTTFAGPCAYCNCCTSSPHVGEFTAAGTGIGKPGAAANGSPILIVDDDASYRASVASILDWWVMGREKRRRERRRSVRSEQPSWVLLDVLLPGATGYASVAS
jgi:hypothetical protein